MLAIVTRDGTSLIEPASFKKLAASSFPISSSLKCSTSAWSPDSSLLYLANSSSIKRYSPPECLLEVLHNGSDVVTSLAMKENILFFAAANRVWSLDCAHSPGKVLSSLEPHKDIVTKVSISNDGTFLASVSASAVFVHNLTLSSYTQLKGLADRKPVTCCLFHEHSRTRLLLSTGWDLVVYDSTRPSNPLKTVRIPGGGDIVGVAASPFSKTLVTAVTSNGDVVLVDLDKDNGILKAVNVKVPLTCCAFTAEGAAIYLGTESGKLMILDLRSLDKDPKSFAIGVGSGPVMEINVQGKYKSCLGDTANVRVKSSSSVVVRSSPQRPSFSTRIASTGSAFGSGAKSPARVTVASKIRGGGITPKKKHFSPARTPLSETKNLGLDAQLAASRTPTLTRRVKPLGLQRSREQEENHRVHARPPSPTTSCGTSELATAGQRTKPTSHTLRNDVEHLGLGSAPESISGHLVAMRVRSGPMLNGGSTDEGDRPKKTTRRIISESVECASAGRRLRSASTSSSHSKVSSSKAMNGLVVRAQEQVPRSTTPDNDGNRFDLSSPELPREPVTPISLGKNVTKAPVASATCSSNGVLGLTSNEVAKWAKGEGKKGNGKEKVVQAKKARFAQDPDTKERSEGSDQSEGEGGAETVVERDGEREQELSLQVSPRRPTAPPTWLQSPHRSSTANLNMNAAAQEFLRNIVHDVMYDFQRETKAEMMGLHLDLVRMGRGWKRELREMMEERNEELRVENRRLREENERLRRSLWSDDDPDAHAIAILQSLAHSLPSAKPDSEPGQSLVDQNVSTYVRVFEDMVTTVVREERHLLNDEEFALLTVFAHLSYNARFLMVKLLLRKQDAWHRLDSLKYESELGSVSAIIAAIDELCQVGPESSNVVKEEEQEQVFDLAMDKSTTNPQQEHDKATSIGAGHPGLSENKPFALARSEREMDLKSLLECLRMDELKDVAKQLKLKPNQKKDDLIKDLLGASSSQSTLTSFARRQGDTHSKIRSYHQTKLSFSKLKPQQDRLKEITLRYIVRCIRVDEEFFSVIHRVNLVYFRLTQYASGILVAALLTRFGKRTYPGYEYERAKNIWPTRQALLDYEEVLILEGQVDTLLAGDVPTFDGRMAASGTPVSRLFLTPVTPGIANDSREGEDMKPDVKPDNDRIRGARMVKDIFEKIYPRWQGLVIAKGEENRREGGLERFHHGHVLTRIICKSSAVLGTLGEHERELEVLEALLAQRRWRRGQRGRWHNRRALILSTHSPKDEGTTERALDAVIEALRDPDTHLVFRPKLQRRLRRLENKLKIPLQDRHACDGMLVDADEVVFEAVRLRHRAASLKLDRTGRCVDASQQGNQDIKRYYSPVTALVKPEPSPTMVTPSRRKSSPDILKGKSLWMGRSGEELTVEALALQRYEEYGFKGVHCETRIIAMLFSLLFWDVIFQPIPGAFETPYQTAPLDIAEDSFYHARKDAMEERLAAIEAGKGVSLIQHVDAENRASGTWCVGVRWDLFSSEDLVDIVKCIGGQALSVICRVLCEDYAFGTSGGPDLFLWNAEKGTCKFVEVKGPGDTLQENQRIWIDILLKAPMAVEICRIVESGDETDKKSNTRTSKSTRKKAKKTPRKMEEVDAGDADSLPTLFKDPCTRLGEQPVEHSSPEPIDLHGVASPATAIAPSTSMEGASSPLKRKASPSEVMSPTPFKRRKM